MTIDEFRDELSKNILKEPYPNIEGFYKLCDESHQKIREMIGGQVIELDIDFKPDEKIENSVEINQIFSQVYHYFPKPLLEKLFTDTISYYDSNQIIQNSDNIITLVTNYLNDRTICVESYIRDVLFNFLNSIKSLKNRYKLTDRKVTVILDTRPIAFCKLGKYGPDAGSCFSDNGSNRINKYNLGIAQDSYVILIKEGNEVKTRMFGFYKDCWNIANLYGQFVGMPMIRNILKHFFAHLSNRSYEDMKIYPGLVSMRKIYQNASSQLSFSFLPHKDLPLQTLLIKDGIECDNCHKKCTDFKVFEHYWRCNECFDKNNKNAIYSDLDKMYLNRQPIDFIDFDENLTKGSTSYISSCSCYKCKRAVVTENIRIVKEGIACPLCI